MNLSDLEPDAMVMVRLDPTFPTSDVRELGRRIMASGALVPGYIPAEVGVFDIAAVISSEMEGFSTTLIPDRNIASRMARIASHGEPGPGPIAQVAVELMAYAQAMNIDIDPKIAFHELAHRGGNAVAWEELRWFRSADRGNARPWIDLALGRCSTVKLGQPEGVEQPDLAQPVERWRRNYVAALKIAELSRTALNPVARVISLLDWMIDDFILAGPAFAYAARYFATHESRGGMIKFLRSPDRERAISGIRNAAWDITYLSEFVRLISKGEPEGKRYILATRDTALAEVGAFLLLDRDRQDDWPSLEEGLSPYWSPRDARRISDHFFSCIDILGTGRNRGAGATGDPIGEMISHFEKLVRAKA